MFLYHLDQIVITCYCKISENIKKQLKDKNKNVSFFTSKLDVKHPTKKRSTTIRVSNPSNEFIISTSKILEKTPCILSKIEMACDSVYSCQEEAEEKINTIERTMIRKYNARFNVYKSNKKTFIKV